MLSIFLLINEKSLPIMNSWKHINMHLLLFLCSLGYCHFGCVWTINVLLEMLTRACLKKSFCKMCVTVCGRFCLNEGGVAGYDDRKKAKSPAKWGMQIAGMIFQIVKSHYTWNPYLPQPRTCRKSKHRFGFLLFTSNIPWGVFCKQSSGFFLFFTRSEKNSLQVVLKTI